MVVPVPNKTSKYPRVFRRQPNRRFLSYSNVEKRYCGCVADVRIGNIHNDSLTEQLASRTVSFQLGTTAQDPGEPYWKRPSCSYFTEGEALTKDAVVDGVDANSPVEKYNPEIKC
jgi:hypothetical protein